MRMIAVVIQVDALRHDYLSPISVPFLWSLTSKGLSSKLVPIFGFEPDAAYIAGLFPDESDGGLQFWYECQGSPYRFLRYWPRFITGLPRVPELILRKLITLRARCYSQAPTLTTARIPFHLLKYFSFPMKFSMEQSGFVNRKTIFDLLREDGHTWFFHGFPRYKVDMDSVIHHVEKELFPTFEFAFIHIGDLDRVGHEYGPESKETRAVLNRVDKGIEQIMGIAKSRFKEVHLVIMGDHGMMTVSRHLDIWNKLKKLPLKLEKDYLVFLDSTMARFWFFSDRAEKIIVDMLSDLDSGHILSQAEKDKYHLNYSHNKFGDVFFLVDPGTLIFPNFYQNRKPVKGMHGYAPETPEQQSALLIHSPKIKESKRLEKPVDMRRVFPTLLDLMDLPIPANTTARSLLK